MIVIRDLNENERKSDQQHVGSTVSDQVTSWEKCNYIATVAKYSNPKEQSCLDLNSRWNNNFRNGRPQLCAPFPKLWFQFIDQIFLYVVILNIDKMIDD